MRKSSERHPLAVLRRIIGMNQPEFAEMVGLSESTIAKIESLRLPLSPENAILIASQTGCSSTWLAAGDPEAPPRATFSITEEGEEPEPNDRYSSYPFTLETFQYVRALRQKGGMIEGVEDPAYMVVADSIQELLRALHRATKAGKTEYAHIKLYNLVQSMTKDLGASDPWDDDFVDYLEQVLDSVVELTRIDQTGRD
jgi:transcriptional regulator with XRE-family HTH domain